MSDADDGLMCRIGFVIFRCDPRGSHYRVTVRGHGEVGQRPLLGTLMMSPEEWHDLVDHAIALEVQ